MPPKVQDNNEDKYAPTSWGSDSGLTDLEVPSGQLVLARRPNMTMLIKTGILNDIDSLSTLVSNEHLAEGEKVDNQQEIMKMLSDPKKAENLFHTIDKVTCFVVVKPEIKMPPNDVTRRKDGVIYADTIDLEDKMFLFNYAVGGTKDVETFRQESDEFMGSMEHK